MSNTSKIIILSFICLFSAFHTGAAIHETSGSQDMEK